MAYSDLRQSPEWGKFLESLGWKVEISQSAGKPYQIFVRKIPLLGSIIKIQRPSTVDFGGIGKLAERHHALFVKLEPLFALSETSGFKKDSWPLLPTKTIQIDLKKSEAEIFGRMKKDARYGIRRAEKCGLEASRFSLSDKNAPLEEFYRIFKETGRRGGFWVPPLRDLKAKANAFGKIGKKGWLIAAFHPQTKAMLAGAIILAHRQTAFYHHAASSKEGQKLFAPYTVMWKTMRLAKEKECGILDLEGIFDPRFPKLTKKWRGFTHFKECFGGEAVSFPGSYSKHYNLFTRLLFSGGGF